MKLIDLINEMFLSSDLGPALEWDETPSDVKDFDGNPTELPIHIPEKFKYKNKKKGKRSEIK